VSDFFLGVIALGVFVMAAIQVAVILIALRFVRRLDRMADGIEEELRPVIASLRALAADATRATGALRSLLSVFTGARKEGRTGGADEEGPLFVG
jgi:hypothetical protein